jgi:hypothetical protein
MRFGGNEAIDEGGQAVEAEKLEEYQEVVRNGQAVGIESLVKAGYLSPAEAEAQLKVLIGKGSPRAEEVLLRLTMQPAQ